MTFHIRDGGQWHAADPSKGIWVYDSGWKEASEVWIRDGGAWHKGYQKSDPVTYTFNPVSMDSWRPNSWRGQSNLRIGSYDFGDHWLLLDFTTSTDSATGLTLTQALQARSQVDSASVTLRRTTGGSSTINSGTYYISWNNGGYTSGTPTNENSTYRSTQSLSSAGWTYNSTRTFSGLNAALIEKLADNEMCVANTLSPVYPSGKDSDYTNIDSSNSAHTLTVTLDFS